MNIQADRDRLSFLIREDTDETKQTPMPPLQAYLPA